MIKRLLKKWKLFGELARARARLQSIDRSVAFWSISKLNCPPGMVEFWREIYDSLEGDRREAQIKYFEILDELENT